MWCISQLLFHFGKVGNINFLIILNYSGVRTLLSKLINKVFINFTGTMLII